MKITTVKKMQECFAGKVCTVMTFATGKANFTESQFTDYFTGVVESLDEDGIFVRHHITGCKSFFPMGSIIAVLEEQTVTQDNPDYLKIAEAFQRAAKEPRSKQQAASPFVDQDMLAKLAKEAQGSGG